MWLELQPTGLCSILDDQSLRATPLHQKFLVGGDQLISFGENEAFLWQSDLALSHVHTLSHTLENVAFLELIEEDGFLLRWNCIMKIVESVVLHCSHEHASRCV